MKSCPMTPRYIPELRNHRQDDGDREQRERHRELRQAVGERDEPARLRGGLGTVADPDAPAKHDVDDGSGEHHLKRRI